jgi:ubiquinone/menaquinone biosynthesis C-methylase UbiE
MNERTDRERLFHDQRFADGEGARPQDRFYVAAADAYELLRVKVRDCARAGGVGLEVGCGTGENLQRLLADARYDAYGIDISAAAIEAANRRFAATTAPPRLEVMDANRLQFARESFDFVFGSGIIHHLELPDALHELRRVLRADGRMIFLEPLATNPLIELYRRATPADRSADETPLRRAHIGEIRRAFDVVQLHFFGFFSLVGLAARRWPALQRALTTYGSALDRWLFKLPGAWQLAWIVIIDARKGGAGVRST